MDAIWVYQERCSSEVGAEEGGNVVAGPRRGWGNGSAMQGRGEGRFADREKQKDGMMKRV